MIFPIYGHEPFVERSLKSILCQSYENTELIVVHENVDSDTWKTLTDLGDRCSAIRYVESEGGLTTALNAGIRTSDGKYIARQDADDIAHRDRLRKQVAEMEKRDDLGIVGSNCKLITPDGDQVGSTYFPISDAAIRWKSLYHNPFGHSAVMLRRRTLEAEDIRYSESYPAAEDYALWTRILRHANGRNLREPYTKYRIGVEESVTATEGSAMKNSHIRLATSNILNIAPELTGTAAETLARFLHHDPEVYSCAELREIASSFRQLYRSFSEPPETSVEADHYAAIDYAFSIKDNELSGDQNVPLVQKVNLLKCSPFAVRKTVLEILRKKGRVRSNDVRSVLADRNGAYDFPEPVPRKSRRTTTQFSN